MAAIPLHDRDGTVRSVAHVDAEDYHRLTRHRWSLAGGVARRGIRQGRRRHTVLMHREVMGCTPGDGMAVEHVNGRKLDNRKENLRVRPTVSAAPPARTLATVAEPWQPDTGGTAR